MKPFYLVIALSAVTLMGCSSEKEELDTDTAKVAVEEQSEIDTDEVSHDDECVIPEVEGYQQVGCLRDGLAGVISHNNVEPYITTNRVGYIDKDGKVIIPFEYDALITGEGGEDLRFNDFSEGLVAVAKNGKFGFVDTEGNVVVPFQYEWVSNFSDGVAVVLVDERYGAIDKTGKVVIPIEYGALNDFHGGFASASLPSEDMDYKYGLIDKNNNEVIPYMYEQMGNLSEGLISVKKEGKWGYVDKANHPVISINLKYEQVNDFSNGLAAVFSYEENSDNLKYGYIDKTGKLVIPMNFTRVYWDDSEGKINFKNGFAIVNDYEGREFCIDTKGQETQCPAGISRTNKLYEDVSDEEEQANAEQDITTSGTAKFASTTDYLALKPNQEWTWKHLANMPNVKEWLNKTPEKDKSIQGDPNYSIDANVIENSYMTAYGTQQQPKLIVLSSGQGYAEDEELKGVYAVTDFFDTKDLVRIKSNCEVDGMFDQKFYKWQKKGYQPLYVYAVYMGGNAGAESRYGIAEDLDEFFRSKYEDSDIGLQSMNQNYDDVVCAFSE